MDIKTLFYLANFENNYEDFKKSLDTFFKNEDENTEYKLNVIDEKEKKPKQGDEVFIDFLKKVTK